MRPRPAALAAAALVAVALLLLLAAAAAAAGAGADGRGALGTHAQRRRQQRRRRARQRERGAPGAARGRALREVLGGAGGNASVGGLDCWTSNSSTPLPTLPKDVLAVRNWTAVSVGRAAICGIDGNASLHCWADVDPWGVRSPPANVSAWRNVSVGSSHACGIDAAQKLHCWGSDSNGQVELTDEVKALNFSQVAAAGNYSAGVTTVGSLYLWGDLLNLHVNLSALGDYNGGWYSMSAGDRVFCAIMTNGTLFCWSAYDAWCPGVAAREFEAMSPHATPSSCYNSSNIYMLVDVYEHHACVDKKYKGVSCFGLGPAGAGWGAAPAAVYDGPEFLWKQIAAGYNQTCMLGTHQKALCLGPNAPDPGVSWSSVSIWGNWGCGVTALPINLTAAAAGANATTTGATSNQTSPLPASSPAPVRGATSSTTAPRSPSPSSPAAGAPKAAPSPPTGITVAPSLPRISSPGLLPAPPGAAKGGGGSSSGGGSPRRFDSPQFHGVAVDWCLQARQGCGEQAAKFYCTQQGYASASDWGGPQGAASTVQPKTSVTCAGADCSTFSYVVCT